jgi:hypothetical protein
MAETSEKLAALELIAAPAIEEGTSEVAACDLEASLGHISVPPAVRIV